MSSSLIVRRFEQWRDQRLDLVLATVVETDGSTYSKPGHRILLASSGDHQGLVSGGCLEGDLAAHAESVLAEDRPRVVTYDLRDEADDVFGLGVGCNGMLRILLQPLVPARDYAPFADIARAMTGNVPATVVVVTRSDRAGVSPGATLVCTAQSVSGFQLPDDLRDRVVEIIESGKFAQSPGRVELDGEIECLVAPLFPVPRLLVLGAGIDAIPLIEMARLLGWRVRLADHRSAYLKRAEFAGLDVSEVQPGRLADAIDLAHFDACVVMSHHLVTDEAFLRELAPVSIRYIGLLGPRDRRERLLTKIDADEGFRDRLHGPVGLDLAADSPETIALSIVAEIQQVLGRGAGRAGR